MSKGSGVNELSTSYLRKRRCEEKVTISMADSKRKRSKKKVPVTQSRLSVPGKQGQSGSGNSKCPPKASSATNTNTRKLSTSGIGPEQEIKGACKVCKKKTTQICICQNVFYCCKKHEEQDFSSHKSDCIPFTVPMKRAVGCSLRLYSSGAKNATTKGTIPLEDRYVVARQHIDPGTVLFKESPIFIAPNYVQPNGDIDAQDPKNAPSFCLGCLEDFLGCLDNGGTSLVFSMCPSCKLPLCKRCYMDKENGKHSQEECIAIKDASKKIGDVMDLKNKRPHENKELIKDLTVLRAIILRKTDLPHWNAFVNLKLNVRFTNSLRTTPEVVKSWVKSNTPIAENYMKTVGENVLRLEDVKRIIALFSTTSVKNPRMRVLYDFLSWMPHSCRPNAMYTTDDQNKIVVKIVDKIKPNAEISINYMSEDEEGLSSSASKLYSKTGLICGSERCKHDLLDTSFGVICNGEKCGGFLCPKTLRIEPGKSISNVYSPNYVWQCYGCKTEWRFHFIQKHVEDTLKELKIDVDNFSEKKCVKSDSVLKEIVAKKLHKDHWLSLKFDKFLLQSLNSQIGYGTEMLQNAVSRVRPTTISYSLEKKKNIYFGSNEKIGFLHYASNKWGPFSETVGMYNFDAFYVLFIDFLEKIKAACLKDWKEKRETKIQSLNYVTELREIMKICESAYECLSLSEDPTYRNYGRIARKSFEVYLEVVCDKILSNSTSDVDTYLQDLLLSYTVCDPKFPRCIFTRTYEKPKTGLIFGETHEIPMKFEDLHLDDSEKQKTRNTSSSDSGSDFTYNFDSSSDSSAEDMFYSHRFPRQRYFSGYGSQTRRPFENHECNIT